MFFSLEKIVALLIAYKYAIIFPIAVVEGPAISVISGSLVAQGYLNIFLVFFLIVLADLVGDTIYYSIGRFGGMYLIRKWNWFFNIKTNKLLSFEKIFKTHGPKLLCIGKMQGLGSIILMAAGITRYPYILFMWYNTIATVIKSAVLLGIGYIFYQQFATANSAVIKAGITLSFIFLLGLAWYILKNRKMS